MAIGKADETSRAQQLMPDRQSGVAYCGGHSPPAEILTIIVLNLRCCLLVD